MKKFSISFLATIVIQLANIGSGVLAARILQPHGRGELAVIFLWPILLATIGQLGLADAMAYLASRKEYASDRLYGTGLGMAALLSLILVGIGFLLIPRILTIQRPIVVQLARMYLLFIPFNFWILANLAIFLGKGRLTLYNILRSLVHVGYLVGILFLLALHHTSLTTFTLASLGGNLLVLICSLYWVVRHYWFGIHLDFGYGMAIFRYGLKVQIGSMASLVNLRVDQLFMSIFLSPTALGIYVVAVAVSSLVLLLPNTLSVIAFSDLANCHDPSAQHQKFGQLVRLSGILAIFGLIALRILSPWVIQIFFGPNYLSALTTIWILGLGMIFLSVNMVLAAGFKAYGLPLIPSFAELTSFFVLLLFLPFLLPRYGIVGVALSALLAYCASFTFNAYSLNRQLGLVWKSFFQPTRDDWTYVQSKIRSLLKEWQNA